MLQLRFALAVALGLVSLFPYPTQAQQAAHELWALDQSGSAGTLHIYPGGQGDPTVRVATEIIDLSQDVGAFCLGQTGSTPVRAHMGAFTPSQGHAIISFVASGHVLFLDATTRAPVTCIDVGAQAHAAFPAPDGSYVIVANQGGKLLMRINADADGNGVPFESAADILLDEAATLDLASCMTPSGAPCEAPGVRPNNQVVCPVIDSTSRLVFATLAGGGLFVVDGKATPMAILAEYDRATIGANGCGGVEHSGRMYINSGGGAGNPRQSALYAFELGDFHDMMAMAANQPAPAVIWATSDGDYDSHGVALVGGDPARPYLWAADRFANAVDVVDAVTGQYLHTFGLAGAVSADPAPDLLAVAAGGQYVYAALRGPCPLTANDPQANNARGATPGVGVIQVLQGGLMGELIAVLPVSVSDEAFDCGTVGGEDTTTERADVHWVGVRRG